MAKGRVEIYTEACKSCLYWVLYSSGKSKSASEDMRFLGA